MPIEAFEEIPLAENKTQAGSTCTGGFAFARVDCCVLEGLTSKKAKKATGSYLWRRVCACLNRASPGSPRGRCAC